MAVLGPVGENEVILGYDHPVQVVTLGASPTSGSFYLGEPGQPRNITTSIAYNASAATVQTAVRTVTVWAAASVSGSAGGPWTITLNSDQATLATLDVINNSIESAAGTINVTVTASAIPLRYWTEQPVRVASVAPYAGRTVIAGGDEAAQRSDQVKATEFVQTGPLYLGRKHLREQEDAARIWDSHATTHTTGAITAPIDHFGRTYSTALASASDWETRQADLHTRDSTGEIYALDQAYPGSETMSLKGTIGTPISYGTICRFRGAVFFPGGTGSQQYAYINAAGTYTAVTGGATNLFSTSPLVSFAVLGDRLFAVAVNGQVGFTAKDDGAAFADWTTIATMVYRGDGYVLQLVPWKDPATGTNRLILFATDGVYLVDDEAGIVEVLGDLRLSVGVPCDGTTGPYTSKVGGVKDGNLVFISRNTVLQYNGSTITDLGPYAGQGIPNNSRNYNAPLLITSLAVTRKWILVSACTYTQSRDTCPRPDGTKHFLMGYTDGWVSLGSDTINKGRSIAFVDNLNETKLYLDRGSMYFNDVLGEPGVALRGLRLAPSGEYITSWFDRGMPDIDKVFWGGTIDGRDFSSNETITVYYQLDYTPDATSSIAGSGDPYRNWTQCLDKDGNAFVMNATLLNGPRGQARFYYDRFTAADGTTKYSRGVAGRAIRHRIATTLSTVSRGSGTVTAASLTVTNAGGIFLPSDVGKLIFIHTSGTVITPSFKSIIATYVSPTEVTVVDNPGGAIFGGFTFIFRYPIIEAFSVISDAKFDRVKGAPITLNLRGPDGTAPDGRTPKRQCDDLEAALDYKQGLPFATANGAALIVTLEHLSLPEPSVVNTTQPQIATGNVSERVPTR